MNIGRDKTRETSGAQHGLIHFQSPACRARKNGKITKLANVFPIRENKSILNFKTEAKSKSKHDFPKKIFSGFFLKSRNIFCLAYLAHKALGHRRKRFFSFYFFQTVFSKRGKKFPTPLHKPYNNPSLFSLSEVAKDKIFAVKERSLHRWYPHIKKDFGWCNFFSIVFLWTWGFGCWSFSCRGKHS